MDIYIVDAIDGIIDLHCRGLKMFLLGKSKIIQWSKRKRLLEEKHDAPDKRYEDVIIGICEEYKKNGCSSKAADLIEETCKKGELLEDSALLSIAEDLQYCNDIEELKSRFTVKERPEEARRFKCSRLDPVLGAVYGDIIGSKYEGHKITDISDAVNDPLQPACRPTDDTMLTIATLKAARYARQTEYYDREMELKDIGRHSSYPIKYNVFTSSYRDMYSRFPTAGYGDSFVYWATNNDERPYGSLGNGSAMRISPVGAMYDDINDVIEQAAVSAMSTHNHIEGVKGAVVTAVCIWMAKNGYSRKQIYEYMKRHYTYGESGHIFKDFTYKEASNKYIKQVECTYSVPAAVISFFYSQNYMDAIRLSACVGVDTDSNACICGGIAGAYYGVPDHARNVVKKKLSDQFGHCPLMDEMPGDTAGSFGIHSG